MTEAYAKYRRSQIAELADWHEGFGMERVSISEADKEAGSPKLGDKIARNPANHDDRWLVAADYFAANFEPVAVSEKGEAEALPTLGKTQDLIMELYKLRKRVDEIKEILSKTAERLSRRQG